jgi:leucyl-tRNA synthetase
LFLFFLFFVLFCFILFCFVFNIGFFEFQNARDHYRKRVGHAYHRDLILRFIEVQALLILPIGPHFAEHIWKLLKKEGLAAKNARWPSAGEVDAQVLAQDEYIERVCSACIRKKSASKNKVERGGEDGNGGEGRKVIE